MGTRESSAGKTAAYSGLDFQFAELHRELINIAVLAKELLTPDSRQRLSGWIQDLESFRTSNSTGPWDWQTSESIQTNPAQEYEPHGRRCTFEVHGEMSAIWTIKKDRKSAKHFRLMGKASTSLRIVGSKHGESLKCLAQWQVEIGDAQSPGCHFHVGVGQQSDDSLFPKGLSVPRLPGFLITPTDALDFLLGELFQDRWAKKVGQDSDEAKAFGGPQKDRLVRLLKWKIDVVTAASGSAWNHLKHARPTAPALLCSI